MRTVLSKLQLASCVSSGDHPRSTYFRERTHSPPNVQFSAFIPKGTIGLKMTISIDHNKTQMRSNFTPPESKAENCMRLSKNQ